MATIGQFAGASVLSETSGEAAKHPKPNVQARQIALNNSTAGGKVFMLRRTIRLNGDVKLGRRVGDRSPESPFLHL
jgi:hypothetical protein